MGLGAKDMRWNQHFFIWHMGIIMFKALISKCFRSPVWFGEWCGNMSIDAPVYSLISNIYMVVYIWCRHTFNAIGLCPLACNQCIPHKGKWCVSSVIAHLLCNSIYMNEHRIVIKCYEIENRDIHFYHTVIGCNKAEAKSIDCFFFGKYWLYTSSNTRSCCVCIVCYLYVQKRSNTFIL